MRFITRVRPVKESSVDRLFVLLPPVAPAQWHGTVEAKSEPFGAPVASAVRRPEKRLGKSRPHCEAHTSQASSAEPGTSLARSSHAPCLDSCVVRASNDTALAFRAPDPDAALL